MLDRIARLAILTALLTWQAAPARANDVYFAGRVAGGGPAEMPRTIRGPLPVTAKPGRVVAVDRQSVGNFHQPWQPVEQAAVTDGRILQARLVGQPAAASWERPIRLPPILPLSSGAGPDQSIGPAPDQLADGTWREDDRYIINLNGQQVRLVKESQTPDAQGAPHRVEGTGGTVHGQLLNRGRPLAGCQVVIRPVAKTFGGYRFRPAAQPIRTMTDVQGVYRFENVPPGSYKLSWLLQGSNRWIRRIAMRPDLAVQTQETTQVKDIRVALRTIN